MTHYKTASRQVHLGYSKIRFHQRQGKVYAQRIEPVTFSSAVEQKNNDILKGLTNAEIEQVKDFIARLKEKRKVAELNIEKISAKPVEVDYESTGGGIITFWGRLDNGKWFLTNTDDEIVEYDSDTGEYMESCFYDESFDAYEYDQKHIIGKYLPTVDFIDGMTAIIKGIGKEDADVMNYLDEISRRLEDA